MVSSLTQQKQIWNNVLERLKAKLSNDQHFFDSFFAETSLHSIENDTFVIVVNSAMSKMFLQLENQQGYILLKSVVDEVTESNYNLKFITEAEKTSSTPIVEEKKEIKKYTFFSHCMLNPKYNFDNFVSGECNKEAIQASLLVITNPGFAYNPLFIYSKPGLGKTHLLHAIGNYYQEKNPSKKVLYISTDDFIDEFVKYVRGDQNTDSLKDYFKTVDLLLIDDIQSLKDKKSTSEMFFTIFNQLVNAGKQIVLTSDRHPNDLQGLEDRLISRFNMGLSIQMHSPDTETLIKILEKKIIANQLNINNFSHEGLLFLTQNFSKNVRELEGALNRVIFHTINIKHLDRIDLNTVKESVSSILKTKKNRELTESYVISTVADYYNMTDSQITSKVRTSQIALARRIAMYLCRELLSSSYQKIGSLFGGRDHSTVISSVIKVETELKTDIQLMNAISDIKKILKK